MKACFLYMKNTKINVLLCRYPVPILLLPAFGLFLRGSTPADSFLFCCNNTLHRCVFFNVIRCWEEACFGGVTLERVSAVDEGLDPSVLDALA